MPASALSESEKALPCSRVSDQERDRLRRRARLAHALDRDIFLAAVAAAAARRAGRGCAGDVMFIDLAVGDRLDELTRAAIGRRDCSAASRTTGKTAVDAIAVRVIGDDEHAAFRAGGRRAQNRHGKRHNRENGPHGFGSLADALLRIKKNGRKPLRDR